MGFALLPGRAAKAHVPWSCPRRARFPRLLQAYVAVLAAAAMYMAMSRLGRPSVMYWPGPVVSALVLLAGWVVAVRTQLNLLRRLGTMDPPPSLWGDDIILLTGALFVPPALAVFLAFIWAFTVREVFAQSWERFLSNFGVYSLKMSLASVVTQSIPGAGRLVGSASLVRVLLESAALVWVVGVVLDEGYRLLHEGSFDFKVAVGTVTESAKSLPSLVVAVGTFIALAYVGGAFLLIGIASSATVLLQERNRVVLRASRLDSKTGLSNPAALTEGLAREIERSRVNGKPVSLALIDLDHFKDVNTRYGHLGGDEALAELSATLRSHSRHGDLVVRWGGDELAWLMPSTSPQEARAACERLRCQIEETRFNVGGQQASLTISVGVAVCWGNVTPNQLLQDADRALYASKDAGRNKVTGPVPSFSPAPAR
jgi:diguanylate cyclase (GGDEF)-like protein